MRNKSISWRLASTCLVLIGGISLTQPALAFADDDARKAIIELRQQIKTLTEANQRARIQLSDQIEALGQEIVRLRGDIEQLGRPASTPGGARSADPRAQDPREQSAFDQSMETFRKAQYKETIQNLTAFLTLYPDSKLAPTAQFYLGSSRFAMKDYKGAITTLQAMVQKYPTEPRAADALLMVASSQLELNNRPGAKTTLQRIVKDYKGTPAADTAAKRLPLLQ
ncbi:tol-pal system protein YbgF [Zwartia sp.]|uniref:tol-pal system protein YbgF n=1 Tax=Zwartia sp. TaxID=2978004 RepID=UPI002727C1AA|nr:tol-pal system protein YbgF [Zwartia sp.]MDO9024709.1 tol-pal system protein YbgF [Zwartia sp.]